MKIKRALCLLCCSLALAALVLPAAHAHHSPAKYETGKNVAVTGVVTKYEWANPHVYIFIEETSSDGRKIAWTIEGQPPAIMYRMGWSLQTLHVGDTLTIAGSPAKDPNDKSLVAGSIKRAQSTLLDIRMASQAYGAPAGGVLPNKSKGIEGSWLTIASVPLIVESAFPNASKLSAYGAETLKHFDDSTIPAVNCIATAAPLSMIIPDLKRITRTGDVIRIEGDYEGALRTVHLNVATHEGAIASFQGHSIGKWEGRTLVIDTSHFAYHGTGNGFGVPSGTQKHLVERLALSEDGSEIAYHFEVTDLEYLKVPRTGDLKFKYRPDLKFAVEACDLANARRFIK